MTRSCPAFPEMVGPGYWLPPEPFEFGWAYGVGCNNLRCGRCGEPVRSEVLPDRRARRYTCGCQQHDENDVYRIGSESEDLYPHGLFQDFTEWSCGQHPDLVLPHVLDGVRLAAGIDWDWMVADAALDPPFEPPGVDLRAVWLIRVHRLLRREAPLLSAAVASLLDADDPRLVRTAYTFFRAEPAADGIGRVADSITRRSAWLADNPDPLNPRARLLDTGVALLHRQLLSPGNARAPGRVRALEVVKEFALLGMGPDAAPYAFGRHDPTWLWTHAGTLARLNREWAVWIVHATVDAPATQRRQVISDIADAAPEQVREAIEEYIPEPERDELLRLIRPD